MGKLWRWGWSRPWHFSARLGHCPADLQSKVEQLLIKVGLPIRIPATLPYSELFQTMARDKKRRAGKLRFVLLRGVGQAFVSQDVHEDDALAILQSVQSSVQSSV